MTSPLLLGLDIGTTNCKAVVYTPDGAALAQSRTPTPVHTPQPGRAEYHPDELWGVIVGAIRDALAGLAAQGYSAHHIASLAVASMAEAGVLLDARGEPCSPMLSWYDNRTLAQARWWTETFGARRVFDITGLTPQPIFSLNKLMWFREHLPEAMERALVWLNMADWVAYRLCGAQATDYSLASRTMAFDLRQRDWSDELLDAAAIPRRLMARAIPSGQVIGQVTASAATATGLAAGTPVATGGHDHLVGAFGVGVIEPGQALNSMGTAESLVLPLAALPPRDTLFATRAHMGAHVVPEHYYAIGGLAGQGVTLEWARALLAPDLAGEVGYAKLNTMAERVPPGSGGATFLAHLRGVGIPHNDPQARGALIGLTPHTGRDQLARAIFEGMAYVWRTALESLEEATATPGRQLRVIGGGARNPTWMQIKADVGQRPLYVLAVDEGTAWGAAALAGLAVGVYTNADDVRNRVHFTTRVITPNPDHAALYESLYQEVYRPLYSTLHHTHHLLAERLGA